MEFSKRSIYTCTRSILYTCMYTYYMYRSTCSCAVADELVLSNKLTKKYFFHIYKSNDFQDLNRMYNKTSTSRNPPQIRPKYKGFKRIEPACCLPIGIILKDFLNTGYTYP